MKQVFKLMAAICAPLLLSGCFLLPGKFNANLKILDGDRYEFGYTGQIQMVLPDDGKLKKPNVGPFDPAKLKCRDVSYKTSDNEVNASPVYGDEYDPYDISKDYASDTYNVSERACTAKELESEKKQYARKQERDQKRYDEESAMAGALYGGPIPGDDESMRAFAEKLSKYAGWQKIEHAGGNIFDVEYAESGSIGNYFSFPVLPDAQTQYPFFQLVRRADGEIEMLTPSIAGQGSMFKMMMAQNAGGKGGSKGPDISEIDGTLTVETNGRVLSNNSVDGLMEKGDMKIMSWKIGNSAMSDDSPRVLIKF